MPAGSARSPPCATSAVDRSATSLGRALVGLALTGLGVAAFAVGSAAGAPDGMGLIGLGALTTIIGVFIAGPVLVPPIVRLLGCAAGRDAV